MIQNVSHIIIANLARATAEYETAWRNEVNGVGSRSETSAAMRSTYTEQADALALLAEQIGKDAARAVHGALIATAAQVHGDRPRRHRGHLDSAQDTVRFIDAVVAGEAGV
jgi:hypothetical protein